VRVFAACTSTSPRAVRRRCWFAHREARAPRWDPNNRASTPECVVRQHARRFASRGVWRLPQGVVEV